jgi:hypothetical protein
MGFRQIKEEYIDFKKREVKICFITVITKENLSYCKELMQYVELRHLDKVKGSLFFQMIKMKNFKIFTI